MSDLINEIAASSEEQTNGIAQVGKAIQQMDQVVQQNAANTEETAPASEELAAQAQGLNGLVDKIAAEVGIENTREIVPVRSITQKKSALQTGRKKILSPLRKKIPSVQKESLLPLGDGKKRLLASDTVVCESDDGDSTVREEDFKDF